MGDAEIRILLLEDNPSDAKTIMRELNKWQTATAVSIEHVDRLALALERLQKTQFDVILTDLKLPDSDGLETVKRLLKRARAIPVVVMTGTYLDEGLALEALHHGAQDYVFKDKMDGALLTRVIRHAIERKRSQTELQTANLKLEELLTIKESFIANVSHELRTPVTVIKEGVGLLLDGATGPLGEEQIKFLRLMDRNCQRLTEFVSNILDLSKVNAGRIRFLREKIKLRELIKEVLKDLQSLMGKRSVKLAVPSFSATKPADPSSGGDGTTVLGDTEKIRQVVTNLLSNAVKFTKEDGMITWTIGQEGKFVTVTVRDDGVGIAKDDIPKLFQEFTQVGEYRAGGTGLGLVLCKNIIGRHKGTISAASEPGKGTAFTFTLPLYTPGLHLEESFKDLVEEAKHSGSPTVALIAVDCEALIQRETPEELAKLLRSQLKNGDVVLGFEPKWLILLVVADARGVRAISRRIQGALLEATRHSSTSSAVPIAIGSAFYPVDGTDAHKLFSIAQDFAWPVTTNKKIKKQRILLGEDEPSVLEVTKLRLEQFGFEVMTAATGEEVLSHFKDHDAPDLLLMDLKMPKLNGLEVAAKLKAMPQAKDIPIVAFTAYGEELKEKCSEIGILHVVKKPFGAGELLEKIHQALGEKEPL